MAGLAIGKGGSFHNPEGQQDQPSHVFHHFALGPFLRRSTYISHNGSIAWSSAEGAFRGHPRRCAEICRSTSYTYLNLCLSLEETEVLAMHKVTSEQEDRPHTRTQRALLPALVEFNLVETLKVQYPLTVKRSTSARHLFVVRILGTRKLLLCLYAICTHFTHFKRHFEISKCHFGIQK